MRIPFLGRGGPAVNDGYDQAIAEVDAAQRMPRAGAVRSVAPVTGPVAAAMVADLAARIAHLDNSEAVDLARILAGRVGDLERECQALARDNAGLRERLAGRVPGGANTAPPRCCPVCRHRMPFGIAHYCTPQSTFIPEGEVA